MNYWKISGIVTDATPTPFSVPAIWTVVEGIEWDGDDVPVTLDLAGKLEVGRLKLSKTEEGGKPRLRGAGSVRLPHFLTFDKEGVGFAMCGIGLERAPDDPDAFLRTRVTHVALERLAACYSPDYKVTWEEVS